MHTVLKQKRVIARKDYHSDVDCNFDFAQSGSGPGYNLEEFKAIGMTDEEIQSVLAAKERKFEIKKGELYYYQVGIYDGDIYAFRSPIDMHELSVKYDLYYED